MTSLQVPGWVSGSLTALAVAPQSVRGFAAVLPIPE